MNGQMSLTPATRVTDPATSRIAAQRAAHGRPSLRKGIVAAFRKHYSLTDDELCQVLELPVRRWPSCKTARSALKNAGVLEDSGIRRDGQIVWQFVDVAIVSLAGERL